MMTKTFSCFIACLMMSIGFAHAQSDVVKPYFPVSPAGSEEQPANVETSGAPKTDKAEPFVEAGDKERVYLLSAGPVQLASASTTQSLKFSVSRVTDVTLSIGYLTGPENDVGNSHVLIFVNDNLVSDEPLGPSTEGRVEVTVPSRMIVEGVNSVKVKVSQSDINCRSGNGVWTHLRAKATYVDIPERAADPKWVSPGDDEYIDLFVVRNDKDKASATAAITASMKVTNLLSRSKVRTRVVSDLKTIKGADLVVNTGMVPEGEMQGNARVISVQGISELREDKFANVVNVESGGTISLREFGLIAEGWSESQHTEQFLIRMPEDFLSRNQGSMRIDMRGTAQGYVDPRSTIEVYVNEVRSGSSPIPQDWQQAGRWSFRVPLINARPGLNRIRFVFNTPTEAGKTCAIQNNQSDSYAIFGDTSLDFPDFAKARRLSITSITDANVVNVVLDPDDDYAVSIAATVLMRTSRAIVSLPEVEVVGPDSRPQYNNTLFVSTGKEGEPLYGDIFGISSNEVKGWRDALRNRMTDVLSLDHNEPNTQAQNWARERYAYRDSEQGGKSLWRPLVSMIDNGLNPTGVSLRGDDAAFIVSQYSKNRATQVMIMMSDERAWEKVSDSISQAVVYALDGRTAHVEVNGQIRAYKDAGIPQIESRSISNLRLVFADIVSSNPLLFLLLILTTAMILALAIRTVNSSKER